MRRDWSDERTLHGKKNKIHREKKSIAIYSIHTLIHYFYAALVLFAIELPKLKCNEKKMEKKKRKKKEERMKTKNTLLYVVQIPDVLGVGVIAAHSSRCAKQANDLRAFADVSDDGTEKKKKRKKKARESSQVTHTHTIVIGSRISHLCRFILFAS